MAPAANALVADPSPPVGATPPTVPSVIYNQAQNAFQVVGGASMQVLGAAIAPTTPGATAIASQIWSGSGAPAASLGANGDFYLRSDTPGTSSQRIYIKAAGSWTALSV